MDTETFNKHMEEVVALSIPDQVAKNFEAVATCIMRHEDYTMIPLLMNMCADIAGTWNVNLKDIAQNTLIHKAKEYALNGDRLWNFKTTYAFNITHPEMALQGYLLKHLNSCMDYLTGKVEGSPGFILEKFGDVYNDGILLDALSKDDE
jgi:hypothetical protein